MVYYAGIGSRETPKCVLDMFFEIGKKLARMGCVLRSGRADGADTAFETGCADANGKSEIFIPWASFQKRHPLAGLPAFVFDRLDPATQETALASVDRYHPAPQRLSQGAKKLMARNYCQIFGPFIAAPNSDFVVCYTKDGKASGGTGQAMRMAEDADIKVFNAHGYEDRPEEFINMVCDYARARQQRA